MPDLRPTSREQFVELADALRVRPGYTEPVAFGIGIATHSLADDAVLDTWYPVVNLGENLGAAAIVADVVGHDGGPATHELTPEVLAEVLHRCAPMIDDGGDHPNLRVLSELAWGTPAEPALPVRRRPVITFIGALDDAPVDAHDVYLRLHLLSHRLVAAPRAQPRRAVRAALQRGVDHARPVRRRVVRGGPHPAASRRHRRGGDQHRQVPADARLRDPRRCASGRR